MIMSMSDIICITNRNLCRGDFFQRIEKIAKEKPEAIVLREKDLSEKEYAALAESVMKICAKYGVTCILHSFIETASDMDCDIIHVSLQQLRRMDEREKKRFKKIGTSCHSVEEAHEARRLGCGYIIAGHIFDTDCKKGVPPRGVEFLSKICREVELPVYAIGGIDTENIEFIKNAGAEGACIMSGFMKCPDVHEFMKDLMKP